MKRVPTYDVVLRTTDSCDSVRRALQGFFVAHREHTKGFVLLDDRFLGEFDGENSFVVQSFSSSLHSSQRPFIDGYLSPNGLAGCDIIFRTTYRAFAWKMLLVFVGILVICGLFSSSRAADLWLMVPAAAVLAVVTFVPLWIEGATFAHRVRSLLVKGTYPTSIVAK